MSTDFEENLDAAEKKLQRRIDEAQQEVSGLKEKRGRLKGRNAPQAQLDGIERRISNAEGRLEDLEDTDPVALVEQETPTRRSFHSA